jgi:rod shape-determining protein MreD
LRRLETEPTIGPGISWAEIAAALVIAAVLELLQSWILPGFLQPKWSLIFALYIGWYSASTKAAFNGTLFGLLEDFLMGLHFGLTGLSRTVICYFVSWLGRWVATEGGIFRLVFICGLTLIESLIIFSLMALLGLELPPINWWRELVKSSVTGIVGEFVFRFYDGLRLPPADFKKTPVS